VGGVLRVEDIDAEVITMLNCWVTAVTVEATALDTGAKLVVGNSGSGVYDAKTVLAPKTSFDETHCACSPEKNGDSQYRLLAPCRQGAAGQKRTTPVGNGPEGKAPLESACGFTRPTCPPEVLLNVA